MSDAHFPKQGLSQDEVLTRMREMAGEDADWKGGRTWSMVYYAPELSEFKKRVYSEFIYENGLGPTTFHSLRRFETEVISMTAAMLGGDAEVVGNMTSGGTESILMAVKAARDHARATRPDVKEPEMLLPVSAHPAFDKAAHYLGLRTIRVPVGKDFRADVDATRRAITENTVFMMGSAPGYPHGVVDPIGELSELARSRGIWFHTDCCLGGFLLPWVRKLGYPIPSFDFSLPGVTSISADIHKYGFAAKGASTVLYRNEEFRRHQFYVETEWPGGIYGTPTLTGARPGGAIATAWAVMTHLGEEGYLRLAREMMETTRLLIEGINAIPGLRVMSEPAMTVFAFSSEELNVYAIADELHELGWHVERQHLPPSLHLMVTPAHTGKVAEFLADLKKATDKSRGVSNENVSEMAAIYGMLGTLPDRSQAKEFALGYLSQIYRA